MNAHPRRQRFILVAAVAAPALLVQGVGIIMGRGAQPVGAQAAPAVDPPAEVAPPPKPREPSAESRRALAFLREQRLAQDTLRSPMDHTPEAPRASAPPTTVLPSGPAPAVPPPAMALTAIVAGGRGSMAVINGRVFRIGDQVAKGWVLTSIDPVHLTAQVTGPQGTHVTIAQPRGDGD